MSDAETPAPDDAALAALAKRAGEALAARGWRAATAESCTGGWVAKALTDVAGSSAWFDGGFVTYANAVKTRTFGIAPEVLDRDGAVSEAVARAMAEGAKRETHVDAAVAVTGIAGPGGGSAGKPVGTVWFAWATHERVDSERCVFAGDRDAVRRAAVAHALAGLAARAAPPNAD